MQCTILEQPQSVFVPLIVTGVVLAILRIGLSKRSALNAIPSVGPSGWLGSWWTAIRFTVDAESVIREGYKKYKGVPFKISTLYRWVVIVSSRAHIEEVGKASIDELLCLEPIFEDLNFEYTMGVEVIRYPHQVTISRSQLTRNLGVMFPALQDEVITAFEEILDLKDNEWKSVLGVDLIHQIVCRVINRAFVGLPVCRDPDFMALSIRYTADVVLGGLIVGFFPKVLRPLAARFLTNVPKTVRRAIKHLRPIIDERRKYLKEYGKNWTEKPNDLLSWYMDILGVDAKVESLTNYLLATHFGATHTSSEMIANALYNLAANTQYLQPLRQEIETIVEKEGWSKASLSKMCKIDSFLTESMRMDSIGILGLTRQAIKDFMLSDGTLIPKGSRINAPFRAMHYDDALYENPEEFDAFRFVNMGPESRERPKYRFVSTASNYLGFGYGQHACSGRHFAALMLKTMLAHMATTYDIKLEENKTRPRNLLVGTYIIANPTAKVMFRKRIHQDERR